MWVVVFFLFNHFQPKKTTSTHQRTTNQKTFIPEVVVATSSTSPNPHAGPASSVPIHRSLSIWSSANSAGCGDGMWWWDGLISPGKNLENPFLVGGFNQSIWKNMRKSNWIISPSKGEHKKYLKPPPSYVGYILNPTELGLMSLSPFVWKQCEFRRRCLRTMSMSHGTCPFHWWGGHDQTMWNRNCKLYKIDFQKWKSKWMPRKCHAIDSFRPQGECWSLRCCFKILR